MTATIAARPRATRTLIAFVAALAIVLSAAPAVQALGRFVSVIVMSSDSGRAAALTQGAQGQVDQYLPIIDGVSAKVPSSRLSELATRAVVVGDRSMRLQGSSYGAGLASAYPRETGADRSWADGNTGKGITVALVDTGVADVPDVAGRVVARANFTKEASYQDTYGHGTFEAGVVAGNGSASAGRYLGIAPHASLMSVKVADASGETSLGQVLAGIQLVDFSAARFNVRVLLLPLDSGSPLPPELDPLSRALRRVWSHGVVVVVPAGNEGPDAGTIASPGNDPVLLTAGSVNDHGTPGIEDDSISNFSSRGPTAFDDDKPDVAAPGEHIVSLRVPGSTIDEQNPSARVDDAYFKGSGTSMSAAVTAGAAALVLARHPEYTPDDVKALLMATASPVVDGDSTSTGAGVVDAAGASSFSGDLPTLPDAPDMGDAEAPFSPPGLRFDWRQASDGTSIWAARQWAGRSWEARQWTEEEWAARQWAARQWAARQWVVDDWSARQWADFDLQARQWAARSWAARSWAARQWLARAWAARTWEARQWEARQWLARQWSARTWDARTWDARTWDARTWDARTWESRTWASRTWESRTWASRSWASRTWESRTWESRTWTSEGWG